MADMADEPAGGLSELFRSAGMPAANAVHYGASPAPGQAQMVHRAPATYAKMSSIQ